jgi:hypothetical protein
MTTIEKVEELVGWVRYRRRETHKRLHEARMTAVIEAQDRDPDFRPSDDGWRRSFGSISSAYREARGRGLVSQLRIDRCDLIEQEYYVWMDVGEYTELLFSAELSSDEVAVV